MWKKVREPDHISLRPECTWDPRVMNITEEGWTNESSTIMEEEAEVTKIGHFQDAHIEIQEADQETEEIPEAEAEICEIPEAEAEISSIETLEEDIINISQFFSISHLQIILL